MFVECELVEVKNINEATNATNATNANNVTEVDNLTQLAQAAVLEDERQQKTALVNQLKRAHDLLDAAGIDDAARRDHDMAVRKAKHLKAVSEVSAPEVKALCYHSLAWSHKAEAAEALLKKATSDKERAEQRACALANALGAAGVLSDVGVQMVKGSTGYCANGDELIKHAIAVRKSAAYTSTINKYGLGAPMLAHYKKKHADLQNRVDNWVTKTSRLTGASEAAIKRICGNKAFQVEYVAKYGDLRECKDVDKDVMLAMMRPYM